jgi:hypothetical protein
MGCTKEKAETKTSLKDFEKTKYYDTEIFTYPTTNLYGRWELFSISGGFSGSGYAPDFDFLEIKEYGIYGLVRNDSLLEFGKIAPALQPANDLYPKVNLEKDQKSESFFFDREKYIIFSGLDTLNMNSPCCDRYDYHFKRMR